MTPIRLLVALAVCALAPSVVMGCNQIVGINDPVNGTATPTPTSTSTTPTGDGGPPAQVTAQQARFIGTWTTTNAMDALKNCSIAGMRTNVAITVTVAAGSDAETVTITPVVPNSKGMPCFLATTIIDDNTLMFKSGQTCSIVTVDETDNYVYNASSSFSINPANGVGTATLAAVFSTPQAPGVMCDFSQSGSYIKQ